MRIFFAGALAAAVAAAACGGGRGAPARPTVRIAAASDLNAAMGDAIARFSAGRPIDVSVSYGSSGAFYAQILNGAPFDLFFSADAEYPRQLTARGLARPGADFVYAIGRLVVWVTRESPIDVERGGLRALDAPSVAHVAIANAEHAPYGRAALAALRSAGLEERLRPKLVFGESVAQALQFAQTGAADAAIVARSLVSAPALEDRGRWADVPAEAYPRLEQRGVVLDRAASPDAARAFREFILSAEGRAILARYGFLLPGA
jgi:molybdate transport system substrate-binding protein